MTTTPLTDAQVAGIAALSDLISDTLDDLIEYDPHLDDDEQEKQYSDQGDALLLGLLKQHLGYERWNATRGDSEWVEEVYDIQDDNPIDVWDIMRAALGNA